MTPAARVQAAIDITDVWLRGTEPLDRVRTHWGRTHRFAGSKDRSAIADLVYDAVRRMRSALWTAGADTDAMNDARALLAGSLALDGHDPDSFFSGERHAPAPLPHRNAPAAPLDGAPRPVRLDYPDWLDPHMAPLPDPAIAALRTRASLDLRVNSLKASTGDAVAALASEGVDVAPCPLAPLALRVTSGGRTLAQTRAYATGLVEIQDAASQAVADLAAAQPGERVLDLCAGGGGKTLALAAAMENRGVLMAHDIAPERLGDLGTRAKRAGASVEQVDTAALDGLRGTMDLVVVDAPCSGSGAWRRNPDAKWRLTPGRLQALTAIQDTVLEQAIGLAKPGGRVLYATCSLFEIENAARVDAALKGRPDIERIAERRLTPLDGADGFFAALLRC